MKHFRTYLSRAVRSGSVEARGEAAAATADLWTLVHVADGDPRPDDSDVWEDWSGRYVDYDMLKGALSRYLRRRLEFGELLEAPGKGGTLAEEDFALLVRGGDAPPGDDGSVRAREGIAYEAEWDRAHHAVRTRSLTRRILLEAFGGDDGGDGMMELPPVGTAQADSASEQSDRSFGYALAGGGRRITPAEAVERLTRLERAGFTRLLDGELERAAAFYGTRLVPRLVRMVGALGSPSPAVGGAAPASFSSYEAVGREILETMAFVDVNVITLRQILIRYDAFCRTFDGVPLSQWYLQEKLEQQSPSTVAGDYIADLFHLDALQGVEDSFTAKAAGYLGNASAPPAGARDAPPTYDADAAAVRSYLDTFAKQADQFRHLLDKSFRSLNRAAAGNIVLRDRAVNMLRTTRYYFVLGSGLNGLNMEPPILLMRGRHLKAEMRTIAVWRETSNLPDSRDASSFDKMERRNVLPLLLNLFSCFLYMMNNYIIEPSSAYYAESLGSNDTLSGLMLGSAMWSAMISAVAYSYWTNTSYRHPIIVAGILCTLGNLLYGAAGAYGSMRLCLVGRSITGFGATRVINRRYVADSTPYDLRTAASAAFALVSALGAAMGPAMAIVLDHFDFQFNLPILGVQEFNGMTGPGFFMAFMWFLFTLIIVGFFAEPSRSGLEGLKDREAAAEAGNLSMDQSNLHSQFSNDDQDLVVDISPSDDAIMDEIKKSKPKSCLRHLTAPVLVTMALIFFKRIALESIVGSTSVVTKNRYGWSIKNVGLLHLVNGLIVIPISILSGWLSQYYQDRFLALCVMVITVVAMASLIDVTDFVSTETDTYNEDNPFAVGPTRYIIGSLVSFSGIEACESYVASLMSKLVPSALAVGTFNSGLLETLVGTSGRATGDILITVLGELGSVRNLLNNLVVPATGLMVFSIGLVVKFYEPLAA